jgi:transcriptional regulator with XRE-family HTH domain
MDEEQAKRLGAFLRARREELGWSSRRLAAECEMNDATIVRIENGQFAAPKPDKLSRITEALGLSLSDVFALADYAAPSDLPHFMPYLRTKYRDLPSTAVEEIERYAARLAKRHGVALEGPAPGEDEADEHQEPDETKGGTS